MRRIDPHIIATIRFLSSSEGGREGPTPSDHFGCPMVIKGKCYDCLLLLYDTGSIAPGSTVTVPIVFLFPKMVLDILREGDSFELWERGTIATGTVWKVL